MHGLVANEPVICLGHIKKWHFSLNDCYSRLIHASHFFHIVQKQPVYFIRPYCKVARSSLQVILSKLTKDKTVILPTKNAIFALTNKVFGLFQQFNVAEVDNCRPCLSLLINQNFLSDAQGTKKKEDAFPSGITADYRDQPARDVDRELNCTIFLYLLCDGNVLSVLITSNRVV